MQNFEFYAPTRMIFGKDTHKEVGSIVKEYGFSRVLLHYGQGSVIKSGVYDEVMASLKEAGMDVAVLGGAEPNPKISLVREGVRLAKEHASELVIALGGGSVIDSAKLIAIGAVADVDPWMFSEHKAVPEGGLPVATILTLSASGSEMSASCVITNEENGLKRGFGTKLNRPLFSICNPCLTYTVNPYQTACGIVDILMHTLERYFTVSDNFDITDNMAFGVIKTVIKAGKEAMANPQSYDARANLMWAGSLSHNDLTHCGTQFFLGCHQLEHELSGMFDSVAHGAGLAIVYPAWAKYIYKYNPERFALLATEALGVSGEGKTVEETALCGIKMLEDYFSLVGMPTKLSDLEIDITDADIEEMAEKCTFFGTRVLTDYKALGKDEIIEIFNLMKGEC